MLADLVQEREVGTAAKIKELCERVEKMEGVSQKVEERERHVMMALKNMKLQTDMFVESMGVQKGMGEELAVVKETQQQLHNEITGKLAEDKLLGDVRVTMQHLVTEELLSVKETLRKHDAAIHSPTIADVLHEAQNAQFLSIETRLDDLTEDVRSLEATTQALSDRFTELTPDRKEITDLKAASAEQHQLLLALRDAIAGQQQAMAAQHDEITTLKNQQIQNELSTTRHTQDLQDVKTQCQDIPGIKDAIMGQRQGLHTVQTQCEDVASLKDALMEQQQGLQAVVRQCQDITSLKDALTQHTEDLHNIKTQCQDIPGIKDAIMGQRQGLHTVQTQCEDVASLKDALMGQQQGLQAVVRQCEDITSLQDALMGQQQGLQAVARQCEEISGIKDALDGLWNVTKQCEEIPGIKDALMGQEQYLGGLQRQCEEISGIKDAVMGQGQGLREVEEVRKMILLLDEKFEALAEATGLLSSANQTNVENLTQMIQDGERDVVGVKTAVSTLQRSGTHTVDSVVSSVEDMATTQKQLTDRVYLLEENNAITRTVEDLYGIQKQLTDRITTLEVNNSCTVDLSERLVVLEANSKYAIPHLSARLSDLIPQLEAADTRTTRHLAAIQSELTTISNRQHDFEARVSIKEELMSVAKKQEILEETLAQEAEAGLHLEVAGLNTKMETMKDALAELVAEETKKNEMDLAEKLQENEKRVQKMLSEAKVKEKDDEVGLVSRMEGMRDALAELVAEETKKNEKGVTEKLKENEERLKEMLSEIQKEKEEGRQTTTTTLKIEERSSTQPVGVQKQPPQTPPPPPTHRHDTTTPVFDDNTTNNNTYLRTTTPVVTGGRSSPPPPLEQYGEPFVTPPAGRHVSPKRVAFSGNRRDRHEMWRREQVLKHAARERVGGSPFEQVMLSGSKRHYETVRNELSVVKKDRRGMEQKLAVMLTSVSSMQNSFQKIALRQQQTTGEDTNVAKQLNTDLSPTSTYLRSEVDKVASSISSVKHNIVEKEKGLMEQANTLRSKIAVSRNKEQDLHQELNRLKPLVNIARCASRSPSPSYSNVWDGV